MREISFRGKRVDNGEWVYGDLSQHRTGKVFIKTGSAIHSYEVILETIGQYIGIKDKNDKKIFEGDVVKVKYNNCGESLEDITVVAHDCITGGYSPYAWKFACTGCGCSLSITEVEVIGNIHDSPELNEIL